MAKTDKLEFGYKFTAIEAPALWGARAIFTNWIVDLLWDRQNFVADTPNDQDKLAYALDSGALKAFIEAVNDGKVWPSEDAAKPTVVEFWGVEFTCVTPRRSGYLYITARLKK